jgi:hypothetical protein
MSAPAIPGEPLLVRLRSHKFGVLATYGGEYPYTSLISLAVAADGRSLVFPTDRQTHKYTNLQHEGRVSVMLDNRAAAEQKPQTLYALTVLGSAYEVPDNVRPTIQATYLMQHPHLAEFLALPQTALIQVTITKIILVETFQEVQEFAWPQV